MTKSLKASLLALAIASFPPGVQAAGLGQINVFSGLGQPLRAEIQVSATAQELQSLSARIGSPEAFRQANIGYSPAVGSIRVSVDANASRPVIRLSSDRPMNEPFVDLLVELDWATGRLVREYTFLLDPVDVAAPKPPAARGESPVLARPLPPRPAAAPAPAPDTHAVRRGDTLHRIASATAQPGVTLDQMLVALYRANRDAFDGDNINRLRAGSVLAVPDAATVQAIDAAEARREIRAQAADFEAYRRGLANAAARRAPTEAPAAEQASVGRVLPRVEEQAAATDGGDQVRVSRSEPAGSGDTATRLQALEEELTSREKAIEDAHARLAQLEQSVRDMQKLLELQSGTLGQLQRQSDGAPATAPAASPPAAAAAEAPAAAPAPDGGAESPPAPPPAAAQTAPAAPAQAPVAPPAPPPAPSFIDTLLDDPAVAAGGAGILVLLLAYAGLKARQRRRAAGEGAANAGFAADTVGGGQAVFAGTGGQSVDTGASSILHTDFSQAGLSSIDADEGVDPVAEADVYMAYGRDAQAEEILLDALKADPARTAIHLKLLEIYAQRKDARQFETVATELFGLTAGHGRDWEKAAEMGRVLDPGNPLYGEKSAAADIFAPRTEPRPAAAGGAAAAAAAATMAAAGHGDETIVDGGPGGEEQAEQLLSSLDFTTSPAIEPSQSQMRDTWALPGGLRRFEAERQAGNAAEPVVSDEPAAAGAEESDATINADMIDFDLDLGEEVAAAAPADAAAAPALAGEPAEADAGLEFDLDIGEPEVAPVAEPGAEPAAVPAPAGGADLAGLDFELPDLDFGSPPSAPFDLEATVIHEDVLEPDEAAASPAPPVASPSVPTLTAEPALDPEKTSFDSSLLDFDFDIDAPLPAPASPPAGLDLASIDLELDAFEAEPAPAADERAAPDLSAEATQIAPIGDFSGDEPEPEADNDDVATKLELARAYDEMGDKEGALELLDEVLREGSAAQKAEAREMVARLG